MSRILNQVFYIRTDDPGKQIRVPVNESELIEVIESAIPVTDFNLSNPFEPSVNREVRALAESRGLRVYKIGRVAMLVAKA